jgi:hypothetical protein
LVTQDFSPLDACVVDTTIARIKGINATSITVLGIRAGQTMVVGRTQSAQTTSLLSVGGAQSTSVSRSYAPSSQFFVGNPITVSAHSASGSPVSAYEWRVNGQPPPATTSTLTFFFEGPVEVSVQFRNVGGGQATVSTCVIS